jgi:16S rRNA U516 pseudouridylate synthase RsuA-like enzyme
MIQGVYNVCMIRTNIHLTKGQLRDLRKLARETGLSVAELVRRAIDEFLQRGKK